MDGNNATIGSLTPYVAGEVSLARYFRYYLGGRRDRIDFDDEELLDSRVFSKKSLTQADGDQSPPD